MKIKQNGLIVFLSILIAVFAVSCADEWDEHYNATAPDKLDKNLYEYLKTQENLSVFSTMLELTGYDSIINEAQTFTVWAPDNEALKDYVPSLLMIAVDPEFGEDLKGPGIYSLSDIRKLVGNHITRFSQTSSGLKLRKVLMLNGKVVEFSKTGNALLFGEKTVTKSDIAVSNGIVHVLSAFTPYRKNLWEFINETEGLESLREYINSLTREEFDPEASIVDGVLMDSIMRETNDLLEMVAALNTEDSTYTAILPDNNAWSEAYDRIFPYFKTTDADGGEEIQTKRAKWALVSNLFFRGKIGTPVVADTLVSTLGLPYAAPARLFENAQANVMSNGLSYVSPQLKYTANEAWFSPIRIEAEYNFFGRLTSNYEASTLSGLGTGATISARNYALFTDISQSSLSNLSVTFPIPNTLSGKYNIYCVFVPAKLVDSTDVRPYKVKFSLKYTDSAGKVVNFGAVTAANEVKAPNGTKGTFTTNPEIVDKMLVVKDFEFPYSNIIDYTEQNFINNISVALKVENATAKTPAEMVKFNRNLRIDCIILEPVQ